VPHAQLLVVPECGHMLTMEQPAFVNAALRRWIGALPA
jgi:pimeloyl-ACP methyl ester carboxylesterase